MDTILPKLSASLGRSGLGVDLIFGLSSAFLFPRLLNAAEAHPGIHLAFGAALTVLYPAACVFLVQRILTDASSRRNLDSFVRGVSHWYSWPLGLVFWASAFFHSIFMSGGPMAPWMVNEDLLERYSNAQRTAAFVLFALFCVIVLAAFLVVFRKRIGEELRKGRASRSARGKLSLGAVVARIFIFPLIAVLGVCVAALLVCIVLLIPFLLFLVVWVYVVTIRNKPKLPPSPLPDTRFTRGLGRAVFLLQPLVVGYLFDLYVRMAKFYTVSGSAVVIAVIALLALYLPYRFLFFLDRPQRKVERIVGWLVFAANTGFAFARIAFGWTLFS